jgi:hypothetical protein
LAVEAQQLAVVEAGVAGDPGQAAGRAQVQAGVLDQDRPGRWPWDPATSGLVDERLQRAEVQALVVRLALTRGRTSRTARVSMAKGPPLHGACRS